MEAFESNGVWWLPDDASQRIAGVLRFSPERGISLSLSGVLGGPAWGLRDKPVPVIHGIVWDAAIGNIVTLKDCEAKSWHVSALGPNREQYYAQRLFVGAHLLTADDFRFCELRVTLSGLSSWAHNLTGLTHKYRDDGRGFEVGWKPPEPIRADIPGGSLVLGVGAKLHPKREITIKEQPQIHIICETPESEDSLQGRYVHPLQDLITLATDHPNAVLDYTVRHGKDADNIHVIAPPIFHDATAAEGLLPHKMIFSLDDVSEQAPKIISRWIELSDRLEGARRLYFAIQYRPDSLVDIKFLTVVQALEVYHRTRESAGDNDSPTTRVSADAYLGILMSEHEQTIGPLFVANRQESVNTLAQYRNYVVHHDSALGKEPEYGINLFWLTQKIMFLFKACLLSELGISVDSQLEFFQRNQMYLHIRDAVNCRP